MHMLIVTENSHRRATIDQALVNMIVTDLQPVSIVEDKGFREFAKVLDPKYVPLSRRTIMREYLPHLYDIKQQELMGKLSNISWCSFTSDLWTSRATMGYLTVTCHFISQDWMFESAVLDTVHVPESHTIVNLAAELKSITEKWKITKKVHCGITDGASNITGAVKGNYWNHIVCFAHKLNLIVTCAIEAVQTVKQIMDIVKRNVTFFHKSTKASEKLRIIQTRLNLPEHKMVQHVETRWNSVLYMLERYLEQEEAVRTTLCLLDRNDLVIPAERNALIHEIIKILQPFEAVTTELSAEKNVSASKILPLARALQKLTATHAGGIGGMLSRELTAQMASRFGSGMEDKKVIAIATLLDPRFKKIPFHDRGAVERMTRQIITDAITLTSPPDEEATEQQTPNSSSASKNPVWEVFDQQAADAMTRRAPSITALTEVEQYFKLPIISRMEDPLQWWHKNAHIFPSLQNVARVYLSTVATSVPSERLFSKAGELISAKRNRIKPKHVNMFLFLNKC